MKKRSAVVTQMPTWIQMPTMITTSNARSMAGVSVMGAIVTARLGGMGTEQVSPAELAGALHPVFVLAIGLAAVALAAVLFVPHIELRRTMEETATSPELLREAA